MAFSEQEKDLVIQALQYYVQQLNMQLPPAAMQKMMSVVQNIVIKLDEPDAAGPGAKGIQPTGINEDWFENVCQTCPKLNASGCTDKITVKFPGKCDPIIKYERSKVGNREA